MTGRIGISLVLLVIALAHLVTDVVRLALEVSPRPGINDPTPVPTRSVEPEMPRPPPVREQPAQRSGAVAHWAFDRPRAIPANRTFYPLPSDFSINHAGIAIRSDMRAGTAMSGEPVLSSAAAPS